MTGLTVVTAVIVLLAAYGRLTWGQALALGAATPSGAALLVGGLGVPTFYGVALAVAGVLAASLLGLGRHGPRQHEQLSAGALLLVLFFAWSTLVTLTAPLMFDGLRLIHPTSFQLVAGTLSSSNIAQLGYLALGICVVIYLARSPRTRPQLLGLALGLTVVLSFARFLSIETGLPFPEGLFDSSPTAAFIETEVGGGQRVRGILSEPAALASVCVTAIAYFVARAAAVRGPRRVGCLGVAGVALYLGFVSTSATFVVAGLAAGVIFAGAGTVRFAARRSRIGLLLGLTVCAGIVVLVTIAPRVLAFAETTIDDKIGSASFGARSSSDTLSLGVFLDTFGYGVGLGSARGSSLLPTLLSSVGIVGTLLLVAGIATIAVSARGDRQYRPVVAALIALLVTKVTSSPDLSSSTLWLCLGLLAHAGLRSRRRDEALPRGVSRAVAEGRA